MVYRGPFKQVEDDDNRVYYHGVRMAGCDKTFSTAAMGALCRAV
jgi:hypothetical protein